MLEKPLTLYTPILLNLIRRRGGDPHNTLCGNAVWLDEDAQRAEDQQVNALLAQHGMMGPRGMDRDLLSLIESIAQPHLEYYGWFEGRFNDAPANFAVLAGSGRGGAFVAVRDLNAEAVTLASERPEELLQGFVNQIPNCRPAAGQPLVAGKSEFTGTGRERDEAEFSVLRPAPGRVAASPSVEMKRILSAERTGAGSLYVAVRNRVGTRRRSERPLNFIDTVEGRWLMEERPGRGDPLVVVTPATPQVLAERLRNAQSALV
ncbi:MAG TPA: ESX secretion-associated protein EspG [Amycolatopsis sp.]|uniref:ESX secretion-associated protein EspG n=1 Tax=Amycolatopsis sp. TaxID=37632 RepID=UPI002B45A289|nr:ESX secretion-associated protein EspG [Amycolatopsis sp.]HKS45287.1 ESX secretion-associated protein EspG [Amycolatopsis sp.]